MCLSVTHVGSPRPLSRMGRGIINYYLARERKFQGTKVPGSESSWNFRFRERKFQGAKVLGTFAPGSESSCYQTNYRSANCKENTSNHFSHFHILYMFSHLHFADSVSHFIRCPFSYFHIFTLRILYVPVIASMRQVNV